MKGAHGPPPQRWGPQAAARWPWAGCRTSEVSWSYLAAGGGDRASGAGFVTEPSPGRPTVSSWELRYPKPGGEASRCLHAGHEGPVVLGALAGMCGCVPCSLAPCLQPSSGPGTGGCPRLSLPSPGHRPLPALPSSAPARLGDAAFPPPSADAGRGSRPSPGAPRLNWRRADNSGSVEMQARGAFSRRREDF